MTVTLVDQMMQLVNKSSLLIKPWFSSIWEPPSGEIESLLFALQAAIGAIIIGYFFGYWRGQGKEE